MTSTCNSQPTVLVSNLDENLSARQENHCMDYDRLVRYGDRSSTNNLKNEDSVNRSRIHTYLFTPIIKKKLLNIILVVNVMSFCSNNSSLIDNLKSELQSWFKVKLLGGLRQFIGLEMRQTTNGIYWNQSFYIKGALKKHNMSYTVHVATPLPPISSYDTSAAKSNEDFLRKNDHKRYWLMVGALSYWQSAHALKFLTLSIFCQGNYTL